jgi:L,D-peptidoglycan transpeptidase YkuD (ErfK/YbiS/YcfS/YnhG family)
MLTIVVAHNAAPTRAGAGSCIFLHLWEGPDKGMSGCIAMSKDALDGLAEWLVPNAAALVALPRAEYEALKRPWGLPFAPELGSHDSR